MSCSLTCIRYLSFIEPILCNRLVAVYCYSNLNTLGIPTQMTHKPQTPIYRSWGYTASLETIATILVSKSFLRRWIGFLRTLYIWFLGILSIGYRDTRPRVRRAPVSTLSASVNYGFPDDVCQATSCAPHPRGWTHLRCCTGSAPTRVEV